MSDGAGLFAILSQLSQSGGLQPDRVGEVIGVPLQHDASASDNVSVVHVGERADATLIASAKLACPASPLAGTASALTLMLDPASGITREDVRQAYGLESNTVLPTPRDPPGSPMALWYRRDWADVMFSFPPTENRLLSVNIDERSPEDD